MWTMIFWKATAERALKTAAQALLVIVGGGVGLLDINWGPALMGVLALTATSVLTSIASAGLTGTGSPDLTVASTAGRHEKA